MRFDTYLYGRHCSRSGAVTPSPHLSNFGMSWLGKHFKGSHQPSQQTIPVHDFSHQPSRASGASTSTLAHGDKTESEYVPLWSLKPVFMSPTAPQVRGREHTVPSDAPNEKAGQNSPDLDSGTRKSEITNGEDEDRGTISSCECQPPSNILAFIDIDQSRREAGRIRLPGLPAFLHRRRHLTLSKLSWVPSPPCIRATKFV